VADLTTLASARAAAGITDPANTNSDAALSALIAPASKFFLGETGRGDEFFLGSRVHIFSGTHGTRCTLPFYPVSAVSSVKVNDAVIPQRPDTMSCGWVLVGDAVELQGYRFCRGIANCEIDFTAGYDPASIPADVDRAVAELIAWKFKEKDHVGQSSKNVENSLVVFRPEESPAGFRAVVKTYSRIGFHA
jgi:hypothetical protein